MTEPADRTPRTEWPDAAVPGDTYGLSGGERSDVSAARGVAERASGGQWPGAAVPGSEWSAAATGPGAADRVPGRGWSDAPMGPGVAESPPGAEWPDVAEAWRAYVGVGERFDELFDRRAELGAALSDAEAELLRRQAEVAQDEEHLRAWHADAAEAWEALVQRVGRSAAGPYPEPYGDDDGNPQKHLVRAQRTVSAPIRFPLLKISLRMALWGVAGALLCNLIASGLSRLVDARTTGTAAHVAAVIVAFVGLAAAPFAGFALARWRLSATTDDDRTDPAMAGLAGGAAVALIWLFVTIATL